MLRKTLLVLLALALFPAASQAAMVGIGDQNPQSFTDSNFKSLGVDRTRVFVGWDSIFTEPQWIERWMAGARASGLEPLVAFRQSRGSKCPAKPCKLPSVAEYTRAFKAFRARYPSVRLYQPWNEANSGTEPTGKKPKRAAEFYNVVKKSCRSCKVVAADVLDIKNMKKWLTTFLKTAKGTPKLWGLHNYGDTNRFRTKGIETLESLVTGKIWLTETGGITTFTTADGRPVLPGSESRATKATKFLLAKAKKDKRIQRIYLYQWRITNPFDRFDAGIVRRDGTPRGIFQVLKKNRKLFR